jgi:hypothetical protein
MEILPGVVFTKFMVYFGKEISDFLFCCGCFLPPKSELILRIFELVSQRK